MLSKKINRKIKSSQRVAASIEEHIALIVKGVSQMSGDRVATAVELILEANVGQLKLASADMLQAAQSHAAQLGDDPKLRTQRDRLAKNGAAALIKVRQMAKALKGEAYVAELGFKGLTPKDPMAILSLLETVIVHLHDSTTDQLFDMRKWIPKLEEIFNDLSEMPPLVAKAEREAETTRRKLKDAIEAFDRIHYLTAKLTHAWLTAIGEPELARRVRSPRRRSNGLSQTPPEESKTSKDKPPIAPIEQATAKDAA
ncbi:MAG: hypothetical protein QNJ97_14605 [Myxococcota bacterium]|nr:hypothetical protein [Myxococcota bacterium]